jgi:prolipoprotein diacylglyceryl transferase
VCRRNNVSLAVFADAAAPGLLLAQAIGRWGNWFNQELFGRPTTLPWGLEIDPGSANFPAGLPADTLFHPTFLYESLWNLLGVVLLLALDRRFRLDGGRLFALYLVHYGLGRMLIELFLRIDPSLMVLGLRVHVWTALGLVLLGLALFAAVVLRRRRARGAAVEPSRA